MVKPTTLKGFDIRPGLYPIRVSLIQWPGDTKPVIDIYSGNPPFQQRPGPYKHNHIKISSSRLWAKIKKTIEKLVPYLKGKPISEKLIEKEILEYNEELKRDNLKWKKTLENFRPLIKDYRRSQIPTYKKSLKDFNEKIKTSKKEEELQKFLEKNTWILGFEYDSSKPQKIVGGSRYDFYVERYDGYADIIEIKKPNDQIFDSKGRLTRVFGKALQQLIEYIDQATYLGNIKSLSKEYSLNFLKPKGILIIGRTPNSNDKEKLENICNYFHNIEVLTYDDLYQKAKTVVTNLEKRIKKK